MLFSFNKTVILVYIQKSVFQGNSFVFAKDFELDEYKLSYAINIKSFQQIFGLVFDFKE